MVRSSHRLLAQTVPSTLYPDSQRRVTQCVPLYTASSPAAEEVLESDRGLKQLRADRVVKDNYIDSAYSINRILASF